MLGSGGAGRQGGPVSSMTVHLRMCGGKSGFPDEALSHLADAGGPKGAGWVAL